MENWTWGLSLIALTIMIHATGIAFMILVLHSIRDRMQRAVAPRHVLAILISLIGAAGLLLAVLHGIEAAIWAAIY